MQITLCPPAYATGYGYRKPEMEKIADECEVVLKAYQDKTKDANIHWNRKTPLLGRDS